MQPKERLVELRNALPFMIWVGALIVALNSGWVIAYRLLYLFSILIALGLIWSGGAVWSLSISREPVSRVLHVGDTLIERVRITNRSYLPQMWVVLQDDSDLPLHLMHQVLTYIGPRSQRQLVLRTTCLRRGRYRLGPAVLTGGDPFGIFRTRRRLGPVTNIVVRPRVFHLESFGVLAGLLPAETRRLRRSPDPTTDVSSVRDYQPGDEFRRIHWLSTVRQGRLISKEFEHSPGGDIWVVLDMHRNVQAGSLMQLVADGDGLRINQQTWPILEPATEEYSVSMAASVTSYFLGLDRAVGLVTYSSSRLFTQPDRSERQLNRILDGLAVLRADGHLSLHRLLEREAHNFKRFDTVVVITPSTDESWVSAAHSLTLRGIRILAVMIDRATFEDRPSSGEVQGLLSARRLPFCVLEKGQRPDTIICIAN